MAALLANSRRRLTGLDLGSFSRKLIRCPIFIDFPRGAKSFLGSLSQRCSKALLNALRSAYPSGTLMLWDWMKRSKSLKAAQSSSLFKSSNPEVLSVNAPVLPGVMDRAWSDQARASSRKPLILDEIARLLSPFALDNICPSVWWRLYAIPNNTLPKLITTSVLSGLISNALL